MSRCPSKRIETPEVWRDIRDYNGRYQVSSHGRVRRVWPKGRKVTVLNPYIHRGVCESNRSLRVRLTRLDGVRKEHTVHSLVAGAFLEWPEGTHPVHKNGVCTDCHVDNIVFMTNQEIGVRFGRLGSRKPVIKIDEAGNIVACYPSARAAARENYLSYEAVTDRCNGLIKREFAIDGCSYRWDK